MARATSHSQFAEVIRRDARYPESILRLQREHETILKQNHFLLSKLGPGRRKTAASRASPDKKIANEISKLQALVNQHQRTEEVSLLPTIQSFLGSETSEWVRSKHQQISKAVGKLEGDVLADEFTLAKSVADFDAMIRAHFSNEENVIFWIASLYLSKSDS